MFNLSSFLVYIFITAYTPGPNNIMAMSNASKYGFRKSFVFSLGMIISVSIIIILSMIFSVTLYNFIPKVKPIMTIIAAIYMLYLAFKIFKSSNELSEKTTEGNLFLTGMLLQFVNPKLILYAITSTSTFIAPYFTEIYKIAFYCFILCCVSFSAMMLWSIFGSVFYKFFSKYSKIVNTVMALLMVYAAVSLFL